MVACEAARVVDNPPPDSRSVAGAIPAWPNSDDTSRAVSPTFHDPHVGLTKNGPESANTQALPCLWNENIWDELLGAIKDQQVIPIVGPDLLIMETEAGEISLDRFLAGRLADMNGVPPTRSCRPRRP